jgi:UDP-4-amino-4-deoxy-L-arabinose-oxoglutarate aminotransferase
VVPHIPDVIPHSRPWLDPSDHAAVGRVLASGMIARGHEVAAFEQELGSYLGFPPGVATSSGTRALLYALRAVGVRPGDDVVVPTYVCSAVSHAVLAAGATPRLCDIGEEWCVDAASIARAIGPRTRAAVVVHTFGIPAEPGIQQRVGVPVIDDCCQAIGLPMAALSGDACVVSFHATKMLATGEGGMAFSRDAALLARMRATVKADRDQMSDLAAALGRSQLQRYAQFLARRRACAARYIEALSDLPVRLPAQLVGRSLFFRFPVRTSGDFDRVREAFSDSGVQVRRGVDTLLHRAGHWDRADFPNAEQTFSQTLSLPIYPALTDAEVDCVIEAARRVLLPLARI